MRVILLDMLNMRERETTPYTIHYDDVILQDMLKRERERERNNSILSDDACHLARYAKHEGERQTTTYSMMRRFIFPDMLNMSERETTTNTMIC